MIRGFRTHGLAWAVCLVLSLLASVWGRPDIPVLETHHVSAAWGMWSHSDYGVSLGSREPYSLMPPLLLWLINLGWAVLGVNAWWPRVISTALSFLCLLLVVAVARRLWRDGRDIGDQAAWIMLGCSVWLFFSSAVIDDILQTACVLVALLGALRAMNGERASGWGLFALGVGSGVLAKGPAVFFHILPVLFMAPWWGRAEGGWKRWYKGLGAGLLLGAVIPLAWAFPALLQGGDAFLGAMSWGGRADKPVHWYLLVLPVLLFPWFFWMGSWRALRQAFHYSRDSGVRFCVAWIVPSLVSLSLIADKQLHYLLPLLPPFALLMAYGASHASRTRLLSRLPLAIVLGALGLALLSAGWWAQRAWVMADINSGWLFTGASFTVASLALFLRISESNRIRVFSLGSQGLVLVVLLMFLPSLWSRLDLTPMARYLQALEVEGVPVAHAGTYHDQYQFYGRLLRPLEEIQQGQEAAWLSRHRDGMVVAYLKQPADLARVRPVFFQPYLGRAAVLLDAESVQRLQGHQADSTEFQPQ